MSNDLNLFKAIAGITVGGPIQAAINTVGFTIIEIVRLPQAFGAAYRYLWKENRIGPKLKVLIALVLPVGAVLALALTPLVGFVWGFIVGFKGIQDGEFFEDLTVTLKTFWEASGNLIVEAYEFEPQPLPPGKRPFDIRIVEAFKGLVTAPFTTVLEGVSMFVLTTLRYPQILNTLRRVTVGSDGMVFNGYPVGGFSLLIVGVGLSPLTIPISGIAGAIVGLIDGVREGYTTGVGAGFKTAFARVRDYHKFLKEVVIKD